MGQVLRIVDSDRYEVDKKGNAWKEGQPLRDGPLLYVRSKVAGYRWGPGYRVLLSITTQEERAFVWGVFHKLLEIAADQPKETRWLVLDPRGLPGTVPGISQMLDWDEQQVARAVEVLTSKELRWLEWADSQDGPGTAPGTTWVRPNQNRTEQRQNRTEHNRSDRTEQNTSDHEDVDFTERVRARANWVVRELKTGDPKDENTRKLILRACSLVESGEMPEFWLVDAVEAIRRKPERPQSPWGYFRSCLQQMAHAQGVNFGMIMDGAKVPESLLPAEKTGA
ncbi:MAG: hypothetical protein ACYTEX_28425 [Planctomycetota bacterium]|jgi:hypothetical protein